MRAYPTARKRPSRTGMTALLAMIYLVIFASLAVGFYAASSMAVQVVSNEQRLSRAMLAAESGMQFIRYQLNELNIPHDTAPEELFAEVHRQLAARMDSTGNFYRATVSLSADGNRIELPVGRNNFISLDTDSSFRATLTRNGHQIRVKAVGKYGTFEVARAIQMDFAIAERASAVFDYGVASRGPITMSGNTRIQGSPDPANGSVLSTATSTASPIVMTGSCSISGDVSMTHPTGRVSYSGPISIAGSTNPAVWAQHVHNGVPEPDFPTIDTSAFEAYATNIITASPTSRNLSNIRIRANTNPSFAGGTVIRGVVYVEAPNRLTFSGNCTIQGAIVVENDPGGTLSTNQIVFSGSVTAQGMETLPESYGELRRLTGAFILAPNFAVTMTGNFGTIGGSIIAGKMTMSGNAGGTVNGTVLCLSDTSAYLTGNSVITINSQGTREYPAGVFFGSNYAPLPDTYQEVLP